MVTWTAAILLIAAIALFVAAPLTDFDSRNSDPASSPEPSGREREHTLAVQALRELDFDYAMGKLDLDDYRALRQSLEFRALASMRGCEERPAPALVKHDDAVPALPPRDLPTRVASVNFCFQCGTAMGQGHNFCPTCGAGRAVAPARV